MTWRRPGAPFAQLASGNRQALAPFGATPLQHEPTIFCAHPHDEPMRATTAADVGLKSTLHQTPSRSVLPTRRETQMLPDTGKPCQCTGIARQWTRLVRRAAIRSESGPGRETLRDAEAYARVATPERGVLGRGIPKRSFPQVWKNLWKTRAFCYLRPEITVFAGFRVGESPQIQRGMVF